MLYSFVVPHYFAYALATDISQAVALKIQGDERSRWSQKRLGHSLCAIRTNIIAT